MVSNSGIRLVAAIRATFGKLNTLAEAMDRTPYDDLADRISRLEREVTRLKEQARRVGAF
jgi:polyhydroxyalkanoate synthesis regulator phasin